MQQCCQIYGAIENVQGAAIHKHLPLVLRCRERHMKAFMGPCKACSRWVLTGTILLLPTAMACITLCSIRAEATDAQQHCKLCLLDSRAC